MSDSIQSLDTGWSFAGPGIDRGRLTEIRGRSLSPTDPPPRQLRHIGFEADQAGWTRPPELPRPGLRRVP